MLFFQTKADFYKDLTVSKMQINASKLASKIVYAHMKRTPLKKSDLYVDKGFSFGLFTLEGTPILNYIAKPVVLQPKVFQSGDNLILTDDSVGGHLGVSYIAIEEHVLYDTLSELKKKIAISFVLLYLFIIVLGFYLTKLFIKPIIQQRLKLNNFIKDTTHELNTPISAIVMSVNAQQLNQKSIDRILISAKRISEIYNDLTYLFLNNIHEHKRDAQEIDLKPIVDEQIEYFKLFAQKKRITLESTTQSLLYPIDKESFIRVINNLISNAIKYTPINGKVTVELSNNIFCIKDTGEGIAQKDIDKIFNRFYRANSVTGGFGIGLNIVSSVCNEYDIKVKVDSKTDEGTQFTLTF